MYWSYFMYMTIAAFLNIAISSNSDFAGGDAGMIPLYQFLFSLPILLLSSLIYYFKGLRFITKRNIYYLFVPYFLNFVSVLFVDFTFITHLFSNTVDGLFAKSYFYSMTFGVLFIVGVELFVNHYKQKS